MLFAPAVSGPQVTDCSALSRQAIDLLIPPATGVPDSFEDPLPLIHALFWLSADLAPTARLISPPDGA